MKITEVITHRLACPVERPYRNCICDWIRRREGIVVEVRTDKGLTGWGEGGNPPSLQLLERHVIGRDPFECASIYDGLAGDSSIAAACGIEIALWDILGKSLDKPVHELFGDAKRTCAVPYASGFFQLQELDHLQSVRDEARRRVDEGFRALKMRLGFGRHRDEELVAAAREITGREVALAVDINLGYDLQTAIEVGRALEPYDILWLEEPIPADDLGGYRQIREALSIPVAGAEGLNSADSFRQVAEQGIMDIIQPDISRAGGFTEGGRISAAAAALGIHLVPHMFGTAIRLAATLQWLASLPEPPEHLSHIPCYLELDTTENELRTHLSPTRFEVVDGTIRIPDGPGLGIEIDRNALTRYSA